MLRIEPLALIADGTDVYRLRCKTLDGEREYKFNMLADDSNSDMQSRGVDHEDAFFCVTDDDPSREWLERSICCFDFVRQSGLQVSPDHNVSIRPVSLIVEADGAQGERRYTIEFEQDRNNADYTFSVTGGKDNNRAINWKHGSYVASWEGGKWILGECAADFRSLLVAILRFDEARYPQYMDYGSNK